MSVKLHVPVTQDESAVGLPLPSYATSGSAGMDLYAALAEAEHLTLKPGERCCIPTGLRIVVPTGFEGQIRARSGMALKYGIGLVNSPGTIDSDFRGELRVLMINLGEAPFTIRRGDRIAQLVIAPVARAELVVVAELDDTERGAGGFGSTGSSI